MPVYKNIPVDEETHEMLIVLCEMNNRKQGAQVKELVKADLLRLKALKMLPRNALEVLSRWDGKKTVQELPKGE